MQASDFEEQASGWLALFSNDNGNCAVCQVVFASLEQGVEWARASLTESGASKIRFERKTRTVRGDVPGSFGGSELVYQMVPVLLAEASRRGADISTNHVHSIR